MLSVDLHTDVTDERRDRIIDSIASRIAGRRLETPAVLFLEMHKPLASIAGQGLLVAMPFLAPFIGAQEVADLSKLMRDGKNVELLIARIEHAALQRDVEVAC